MPLPTGPRRRAGVGWYVLVAACLALVAVAAVLVAVRRDPPAPAAPSLPAGFVDLGSVDDLAPGEVCWFEQHRLYLVRTGTEFVALSQSPFRGFRLVTRADLDLAFLGPEATFADPCHGSTFQLDGTKVGGGWSQVAVRSGRALWLVAVGDPISHGHATEQMLGEIRNRHGGEVT